MSFRIVTSNELDKILAVLERKDRATYIAVQKKMAQIASLDSVEIEHFKNLRGSMSDFQRVHVGSFVLFFRVQGDAVIFDRFRHHDDAYRR